MIDTVGKYALLYLLAVAGGNYAVRWVLGRVPEVAGVNEGLARAGRWIGYLERLMILTMILGGSYSAVGFVFAGKAIARFREQKQTEYYLLGTFTSFAWAVVLGYLGNAWI